jgi:hypothetical protein
MFAIPGPILLEAITLTIAVAAVAPVAAESRAGRQEVGRTAMAPAEPAAWLVELEEPGAAVAWAEVVEGSGPAGRPTHGVVARASAAAASRLRSIAAAQDALAPALVAWAREIYRVQRALNGIAVLATRQAAAFRRLPV